jgi:hypothetical protein
MSWLLEFPYCTRLNGSVGKGYASYFVMAERLCTDFVSPAQDRLLRFVSPGAGRQRRRTAATQHDAFLQIMHQCIYGRQIRFYFAIYLAEI